MTNDLTGLELMWTSLHLLWRGVWQPIPLRRRPLAQGNRL